MANVNITIATVYNYLTIMANAKLVVSQTALRIQETDLAHL